MVQLTRIYTRGGDKGKTSLSTGKRVVKHHLRVSAYGEVDELNSALGFAIAIEAMMLRPSTHALTSSTPNVPTTPKTSA